MRLPTPSPADASAFGAVGRRRRRRRVAPLHIRRQRVDVKWRAAACGVVALPYFRGPASSNQTYDRGVIQPEKTSRSPSGSMYEQVMSVLESKPR